MDFPCKFLDENNNCSIYQYRPMKCKEYPFSFNDFVYTWVVILCDINACPLSTEIYNKYERYLKSIGLEALIIDETYELSHGIDELIKKKGIDKPAGIKNFFFPYEHLQKLYDYIKKGKKQL